MLILALIAGVLYAGSAWGTRIRDGVGRLYAAVAGHEKETGASQVQWYTCGMHPWVVLPHPGDCPICHMKLVPVDGLEVHQPGGHRPGDDAEHRRPRRAGGHRAGHGDIRTVGTIDYDETAVRDVNMKIAGWVEKLYVNSVGMPVRKGQPLFDVYSPDLYTAQEEYLQAYRAGPRATPASAAANGEGDMLSSARKRLENYDITDEQIRQARILRQG